jgi:hypothetical protein
MTKSARISSSCLCFCNCVILESIRLLIVDCLVTMFVFYGSLSEMVALWAEKFRILYLLNC